MNNKHTLGPWRNAGRDIRGLPCSLVAAETLIAKVHSKCYGDVVEEVANANLIAAAPDLLEALMGALEEMNIYSHVAHPNGVVGADKFCEIHSQVFAAIAKARGEE